jgi:hypothetical protein
VVLAKRRPRRCRQTNSLLHARKQAAIEFRLFQDDIAKLRAGGRKLDAGLDELFAMHKQFEESGVASRELIAAQSRLGRAQFEAGGLLISITHLRDLRQTTEIAAHNLRPSAN